MASHTIMMQVFAARFDMRDQSKTPAPPSSRHGLHRSDVCVCCVKRQRKMNHVRDVKCVRLQWYFGTDLVSKILQVKRRAASPLLVWRRLHNWVLRFRFKNFVQLLGRSEILGDASALLGEVRGVLDSGVPARLDIPDHRLPPHLCSPARNIAILRVAVWITSVILIAVVCRTALHHLPRAVGPIRGAV